MILVRQHPFLVFGLILALGWAATALFVRSAAFAAEPGLMTTALTIDLTLTSTALWAWLGVRLGRRSPLTLLPVLLLGIVGARLLLPSEHRSVLWVVELLLVLIEISIIGLVAWNARKLRQRFLARRQAGDDFLTAVEQATTELSGHPWPGKLLASEMAVLRYGLFGWWEKARPGPGRFTVYRESGWPALATGLGLLILFETVGAHLLVMGWSEAVAWVLTALSLYTLVWLAADWNLLRTEPVELRPGGLFIQVGLRWRIRIPWQEIIEIRRSSGEEPGPDLLDASVSGDPGLLLVLRAEQVAQGPLGIRRPFRRLALSIDEAQVFVRAVEQRLTHRHPRVD